MKTIPTETAACAESEPFALMVLGDAMAPEFPEGMVIVVDPAQPLGNGAYVVAETDGDIYFRQFVQSNGAVFLHALNPDEPDIKLGEAWKLKGVVVQARFKGVSYYFEYKENRVQKYTKTRTGSTRTGSTRSGKTRH